MNTFFTADTHFGHANIIKYCKRPFANIVDMNNTIIDNWNRVVGEHDLIYHLGDFCFGREGFTFESFRERLKGTIVFIKGNHDKLAWAKRNRFYASYDSYHEICINGQEITLCHYPLFRWNKSHHFSWMLHGHCHYAIPETRKDAIPLTMGLILDIGVDGNNFTPYSFEEIKAVMNKKRHHIEEKVFQSRNGKRNSIHEIV